jgi:cell division protein FtsB
MTNNRNLIILLAILLVMRFIVVPIFDWQTQTLSTTQSLQDKLDKSVAYISELPSLHQYRQALSAEVQKRQAAREYVSDISRYQLDKFRQFESLMQKHHLEIKSSNWSDAIKTAKGVTLQLRLQFSGSMKDFIAFHLALDSLSNTLSLNNLNLTLNGQSEDKLGSFTGNINVQFLPLERNDEDN